MAGTTNGGKLSVQIIKEKYGADFYQKIGAKGGSAPRSTPRGFALDKEHARTAGKKGASNRWKKYKEAQPKKMNLIRRMLSNKQSRGKR